MLQPKYLQQITYILENFLSKKNVRCFVYGSSLSRDHFGDVDVAIEGNVDDSDVGRIKEVLEDSTLPYIVDVVNFNKVSPRFKQHVLSNKILWIKH